MTDSDPARDWTEIDADAAADEFVDSMDRVAEREGTQQAKQRSYEHLNIQAGDHVLDVGCGQGVDVYQLAERVGPDGEAVGVDNSETLLDAARERGEDVSNARFELDDATELSFPDNSFDAVRAERLLLHLEDPEQAVSELVRVVRPGGRVGLVDSDLGTTISDTPGGYSFEFLSLEHAPARNPRIGRQLFRLAKQAGLSDIDPEVIAGVNNDFEYTYEIGMIEDWLEAMIDVGEISRVEADEWVAGCREANEEDLYFSAGMGFLVAGTVPENDASSRPP